MKYNSKITKKEILRLAKLSRLKIKNKDIEKYTNQLNDIINYVSKLNEVELDDVEPLYNVLDKNISGRKDEIQNSVNTEELLKNAPNRFGDFFKVPSVLNGKKESK